MERWATVEGSNMPKIVDAYKNIELPKSNTFIYCLIDPTTNEVRYVGQTINGIKRIKAHYFYSDKITTQSGMKTPSQHWICKLKKQGKIFKVGYLEYTDNVSLLNELEIKWIAYYRSLDARLLNLGPGGDSEIMTTEKRKMISERTSLAMQNEQTKNKCRENLKRQRELGLINSVKWSEEDKKRISKDQEKVVIYFELNGEIFRGLKKMAEKLNCTISAVNHYVHGRAKSVRGVTPLILKGGR